MMFKSSKITAISMEHTAIQNTINVSFIHKWQQNGRQIHVTFLIT
jgi:hypothetical protein